jgi:DNA-binding MarR family transcriptional regulator
MSSRSFGNIEPFDVMEGKRMREQDLVRDRTQALLRAGAALGAQLSERTAEPSTDSRALRLLDTLADEVLTPGRLAAELALSPAATTALVDRLVAADLVERVRDLPDRRQVRLRLTDTAHRFGEELLAPWARRIDAATARLTPREAAVLRRYLEEVLADDAG